MSVVDDNGDRALQSLEQPETEPSLPATSQASRGPWPSGMLRRRWMILIALVVCLPFGYMLFRHWRRPSVAVLNRQCHELSSRGKWNELGDVAEQWADVEPQRADPWLYRAEAAEGLKDWPSVAHFLDRVPRSDPRAVAALVRKAAAEFESLNRPWEGVKTCDEVLQSDPRVLIAHKQAIFFYAMTLQRAEMVRRIRKAIRGRRESPESYVYLVSASWLYSGSLYRHNTQWLKTDPDNELFQVARALQVYTSNAKLDLEHAAEFEHIPPAEQLLQKYPHNLELVAYFLNRSITEADLERVRELLQAVPQHVADADPRFWRARAWCDDVTGDFKSAELSLRRAFKLDPYWWQIHFQLHDLLRRLGRVEESAKFLKIYQVSRKLGTEIMALSRSLESLNDRRFCRSLLELAELIEDDEVVSALRQRFSSP